MAQKCKARTKSGDRCKNLAVNGSDYCHIPSHQAQGAVPSEVVGAAAGWPWRKPLLWGLVGLVLIVAACLIPKIVWMKHSGEVVVRHQGPEGGPVEVEMTTPEGRPFELGGKVGIDHDGELELDIGNKTGETFFKVEPVYPKVVPSAPTPTPAPTPTSDRPSDRPTTPVAGVVTCGGETSTVDHGPAGAGDGELVMALAEPPVE